MSALLGVLFGFIAGGLSGMGMGGGTVLIPLLTLALHMDQAAAQGVNLLVFVPASVLALIVHHRAGRLETRAGRTLFALGALGALGGAFLASLFDPQWLRRAFGAFLILLAGVQFFSAEKR